MSLFFRKAPVVESRAITSLPDWGSAMDLDSPAAMVSSLAVVPVFAATRLIADSISTLPLQQFRKSGATREPMTLAPVFGGDVAGRRIAWIQQAVMSLLLRGNAYGYDVNGRIVWLNPEKVQVDESSPSRPVYRYNGAELTPGRVKHIPAYSLPGSIVGVSPIGACAQLGTTGAAAQKMMADWFANRALPGSTFQNTEQALLPPEAQAIRDSLVAQMRAGKPMVFGKDWKFNALTISASDAAFLDAAKLNATQVATIYGIPPEMIGGESASSLTYSTVELNTIQFATFALRPWLTKLEEEFSTWIPSPQQVRFNVDAMIRVDTKTRYDIHRIARDIGLNNIDELRALEDLRPLPNEQGQDFTPLAKVSAAPPKETR